MNDSEKHLVVLSAGVVLIAVLAFGLYRLLDQRGQIGEHCRPDGTCIGALVCTERPETMVVANYYCEKRRTP